MRILLLLLLPVYLFAGDFSVRGADSEYFIEIARGNIPKTSCVQKFGRNKDIDDATFEDIWDGDGTWLQIGLGSTLKLVSKSTKDSVGGVGARIVTIKGLDSSFNLAQETDTLKGTDSVNTQNKYIMVYRMFIETAGDTAGNADTVKVAVRGTTMAMILPLNNQTLMSIYQIPAGKTGYLVSYYGTVNKSTGAAAIVDVKLVAKPFGGVFQIKNFHGTNTDATSEFDHDFNCPVTLNEKTIVKMQALSSRAGTDVGSGFNIILIDN